MKRSIFCIGPILVLAAMLLMAEPKPKPAATAKAAAHSEMSVADGEQRYRANCSRCHQAPPRFAPGAMGTMIRHMRVRAMITDEDMHAILKYMTQ